MDARPEILNHNTETVPGFTERCAPGQLQRTLKVLSNAKELGPDALTKSGLMVGLGEQRGSAGP